MPQSRSFHSNNIPLYDSLLTKLPVFECTISEFRSVNSARQICKLSKLLSYLICMYSSCRTDNMVQNVQYANLTTA